MLFANSLSNTFRILARAVDTSDSNEPNWSSVRPILTEQHTFPRLYHDLLRTHPICCVLQQIVGARRFVLEIVYM
jgi:hypothetical protein